MLARLAVSMIALLGVVGIACGGGGGSPDAGTSPDGTSTCQLITTVLPGYDLTADATVPEGCWLVQDDLYVSNSATLTVMPGATLKFKKATGINVNADGALQAEGTTLKTILFTGQEAMRGHWGGIYFANSASAKNVLAHVTVEFAGARSMNDDGAKPFSAGVFLDSSGYEVRARISQSTIRESSGYGFYFDHTAIVPDFSGNTITKNASGAGYVYATAAHNLSSSSTYTGNDVDLVFVNGAYEFGDQDRAWPALDVPYHLDGVLIIHRHLTIAAGAKLLFRKNAMIEAIGDYGGITAIGTAERPVLFSGTEQTAGHWGGLYFSNTNDADPQNPRTRLEHVVIEYGGSYTFNDSNATPVNGNLLLDGSGWNVSVRLSQSTVRKSSGWGVWLECLGVLTGDGNSFTENTRGDKGQEDNCL